MNEIEKKTKLSYFDHLAGTSIKNQMWSPYNDQQYKYSDNEEISDDFNPNRGLFLFKKLSQNSPNEIVKDFTEFQTNTKNNQDEESIDEEEFINFKIKLTLIKRSSSISLKSSNNYSSISFVNSINLRILQQNKKGT